MYGFLWLLVTTNLLVAFNCYVHDMHVRHVLDVMYIEKNDAESVLKFLFGENDFVESRRDLEESGQ